MKIRSLPAFVRRRGLNIGRFGTVALALTLVCGLSACSSSVDRRADAWGGEGPATASPKPTASQGGAWETVFATPGVNARLADAGEGPEYSRLDSTLSPRGNEPVTALSAWPEAPRADLARSRSVRVRDNESSFIYYFPTGSRRGTSGGTSSDRAGWWY